MKRRHFEQFGEVFKLGAAAIILVATIPSSATADTLPGAACTAGQLNHVRSNTGMSATGAPYNLVQCDGSTWVGVITGSATGVQIPNGVAVTGDISPASITGDQNDYNPAGQATASVLRLSTNASRNLTGLAGGADGRTLTIFNVGANPLVLNNQNTGSTAANRFAIGADITLAADQSVSLIYDSTSQRWRARTLPAQQTIVDCEDVGDLCADGTVFVGYHPLIQERLFIPPTDQDIFGDYSLYWGPTGTNYINPDSAYDGRANRAAITGAIGDSESFNICEELTFGGQTDWYLPSHAELGFLWSVQSNLVAAGNITDFQNSDYWSSTEVDNTNAWAHSFGAAGERRARGKNSSYRVRCIRRGTPAVLDCANIGDLCADGTVFAGYQPITHERMFIPTTDQSASSKWRASGSANDVATDSSWDGRANTSQAANTTQLPAFKLCKDLAAGGHSDWYLPSKTELYNLMQNRGIIEAGGNITNFQNAAYWSSTEVSTTTAWYQYFSPTAYFGESLIDTKTDNYRVRCLRR